MFFKFDGFTNRLGRTTPLVATNPGGLAPPTQDLSRPAEFHFENAKVKPVKLEVDVRYTHGTHGQSASAGHTPGKALGTVPALEGYANVVKYQNAWIASENLMVWQKRGMRDVGPYYATLGACACGVLYGFYLISQMSFPKKAE
jgi:hypothetical protein